MAIQLGADGCATLWGVTAATARAKLEGRRPVMLTEAVALVAMLGLSPRLCDSCHRPLPECLD